MSFIDALKLELPIIQAPMAGSQDAELAMAVANAGALGSIPCGMLSSDQVVAQIEWFKQHSTSPYNLNFFCHDMPTVSGEILEGWQHCLQPYYDELEVQPELDLTGLRRPFSHEVADFIEPYTPPVLSFHFGLPESSLLNRVKSWGCLILSSATTLEEALWLEAQGVDAVIAQGIEAGGHRGMFLSNDLDTQVATFELLADCVKNLSIPVIAAGGIADADGIRKALNLGASAVQLGTLFLLCEEARTSRVHRQALQKIDGQPTDITNLFSGRPARGISNRLMQSLGALNNQAPPFPYATPALISLRRAAEQRGSGDFSPLWSGTNRSGCQEISATELLLEIGEQLRES